jgi:O-antigen/teichoic acid export membrane protein
LAQLLAYSITFVVCLTISLKLTQHAKINFSLVGIAGIIKKSLPYAIVYFLMTTYYRIDGVMLERMRDSHETGIYAQGYRIIESINNIGYLFGVILLPIFSFYLSKQKNIKEILFPALNIMVVIIVGVVGLFYFQSLDIISLLYHSNNIYSAQVFSWLILNFIPIGLLYVLGTLLTAKESFKMMIPTLVIAVLLNIILNYILIKKTGAIGAAQATLITQLFMLLVYSFYTYKQFNIKFNLISAIKYIAFVVLSICSIQILLSILNENTFINIISRSVIYLSIVAILSVVFQILKKDIFHIRTGIH